MGMSIVCDPHCPEAAAVVAENKQLMLAPILKWWHYQTQTQVGVHLLFFI